VGTPDPEEWRALSALLDEALDLDDAARAAWLAALAVREPVLAPKLVALLAPRDAMSHDGFMQGTATPPPVTGGRAGARCGPYRLETLIGRGGMGSVWRAHRDDGRFDAVVAVKLLSGSLLGADGERRFRREGQILARLRHPNIAQLLDAGVSEDGQPYLVLEHIEGVHLDVWCREQRLDVRARVRLFLDVLAAVAHAHASLVVHRDLKPSNILVDTTGGVKLLDFGIAKLIEDEGAPGATALTREGGGLLTPLYASPEQVTGGPVTTGTDIYTLGVILFELLSETSPYRLARESRGALEEAIVTGEPLRPSDCVQLPAHRRQLQGDLDTIALKALRKRAGDRYATVTALAEDLEAWLDGRPVRARPASLGYRTARFVRRHALAVAAAAAVVVAVLGGAGAALWQARLARAEQARAEEVTAFITGIFRDADPYLGDGKALTAVDLLKQAATRLDSSLAGRPELRYDLSWLLGSSLASLQAYKDADPILHEVEAMARARFGESDPRTLRAQVGLAGLYRSQGKLDAMDTLLVRVLRTLRAQPAPAMPILVGALIDSAHLAIDRGQGAAAIAPVREADSLARTVLPPGHEHRVNAVQVYAVALENLGEDREAALRVAERAVEVTRAHYGGLDAHPRVIEGQMVLGRAYGRVGRTREAIDVLVRADSASLISMGPDAFTRAFIIASRANYRLELWQLEQSLAEYDEARRVLRANGDSTSVSYGVVLANRGNLLVKLGRGAEAIPPLEEAIRLLTAAWGDGHPRLAVHQLRLAQAEALSGETNSAQKRVARVAADTTLPRATRVMRHFTQGLLLRLQGRAAEAVRAQEAALALSGDSTSAAGQRERALSLVELAQSARAAGDLTRARTEAIRARAAYRAAGVDTLPAIVERALAGL
jgi:serine/threonine-protein kinase